MIEFADTPTRSVTMALAADGVTLEARHAALHFRGDWAISAEDDARFFGRCSRGPGQPAQAASLQIDRRPGGPGQPLTVTLRAVDGQVVLGPLVLQPTLIPIAVAAARRGLS